MGRLIVEDLITEGKSKICLLVIDGLGDIPKDRPTPLEAAQTPNLDAITPKSALGLLDPVQVGVTPGSGPGHLALFGYDPIRYKIGRGLLEALGVGIEVGPLDLCLRANFATKEGEIVVDRRAGRITTEECVRLCQKLEGIDHIEDVRIRIRPGKEHRFVVVFTGEGLSDAVTDADPQRSGKELVKAEPLTSKAEKTARIINQYISMSADILKGEPRANFILLRGAAAHPKLRSFPDRYRMKALAIATFPMYLGIGKLVGMETLNPGPGITQLFVSYQKNYDDYDFFYIHIKETDKAGEDGNYEEKIRIIEDIDHNLHILVDKAPDVLAITADHSTPVSLRSHSWHPCPILIHSRYLPSDGLNRFTEKNCCLGSLGRIAGIDLMPILLASGLRLKKYGA